MKANAGRLFEEALNEADIDLKPGTEFKVKVQGKGKHLRLVVGSTKLNEFEASILERSKNASENPKPYQPKLPLGERIRALRKAAGLTIEALASKAEMSKGSLCSIEKGERSAGLTVLRKIAKAIGCSVSVLVD
ncbi:MAG: helix-turn-helix transcriptional regulator [Bdellovibrionota bacterium]